MTAADKASGARKIAAHEASEARATVADKASGAGTTPADEASGAGENEPDSQFKTAKALHTVGGADKMTPHGSYIKKIVCQEEEKHMCAL